MSEGKASLAVVILTLNEALHIERAVSSVRAIARQVFVVDSGSTDGTQEIARKCGAEVLHHRFVNYAQQFQWALDNAPIDSDWIMRLDADEVVGPELALEIASRLPGLPPDVAGINLDQKRIFMGRWLRFGGRYPLRILRIWRRGLGRIEDRWMDEHMIVRGGRTVVFDCKDFADWNLNDLTFFTAKHNNYAIREAIDVLNRKYGFLPGDEGLAAAGVSLQASSRRWLKTRVYNRLPFALSSALYFVWRYFFQLGFLDGREGLVYHFLQGWWYRFLVGAKVMEYERAIAHLSDKHAIAMELSRLTGHALVPPAVDA